MSTSQEAIQKIFNIVDKTVTPTLTGMEVLTGVKDGNTSDGKSGSSNVSESRQPWYEQDDLNSQPASPLPSEARNTSCDAKKNEKVDTLFEALPKYRKTGSTNGSQRQRSKSRSGRKEPRTVDPSWKGKTAEGKEGVEPTEDNNYEKLTTTQSSIRSAPRRSRTQKKGRGIVEREPDQTAMRLSAGCLYYKKKKTINKLERCNNYEESNKQETKAEQAGVNRNLTNKAAVPTATVPTATSPAATSPAASSPTATIAQEDVENTIRIEMVATGGDTNTNSVASETKPPATVAQNTGNYDPNCQTLARVGDKKVFGDDKTNGGGGGGWPKAPPNLGQKAAESQKQPKAAGGGGGGIPHEAPANVAQKAGTYPNVYPKDKKKGDKNDRRKAPVKMVAKSLAGLGRDVSEENKKKKYSCNRQ